MPLKLAEMGAKIQKSLQASNGSPISIEYLDLKNSIRRTLFTGAAGGVRIAGTEDGVGRRQ